MSDQTNTNITRLRNTNLVTENPYSDDSDRPTISASGPCWFRCDQASSLEAVDSSSTIHIMDEVDSSFRHVDFATVRGVAKYIIAA